MSVIDMPAAGSSHYRTDKGNRKKKVKTCIFSPQGRDVSGRFHKRACYNIRASNRSGPFHQNKCVYCTRRERERERIWYDKTLVGSDSCRRRLFIWRCRCWLQRRTPITMISLLSSIRIIQSFLPWSFALGLIHCQK